MRQPDWIIKTFSRTKDPAFPFRVEGHYNVPGAHYHGERFVWCVQPNCLSNWRYDLTRAEWR